MEVSGTKKRHIVVVKSMRDSTTTKPVKHFLVSHKPKKNELEDLESFEPYIKGNTSPTRPEKDAKNQVMSRSILGDVDKYKEYEAKENESRPGSGQPMGARASTTGSLPPSRSRRTPTTAKGHKKRGGKQVMGNIGVGGDSLARTRAVDDPMSNTHMYLTLIQEERDTVLEESKKAEQRSQDNELDGSLMEQMIRQKTLQEQKILTRWQQRQKDWENIELRLLQKVDGRQGTSHKLMMSNERQSDFREQNEKYFLMTAAVPPEERFSNTNWVMSLRAGGITEVQIGHLFSGLQCKVKSSVSIPPILRKPRVLVRDVSSGATGSYNKSVLVTRANERSTSTEVAKSFKQIATERSEQGNIERRHEKQKLEKIMSQLRREVNPYEVEGLFLKAIDLFDWAIKSSEEYFENKNVGSTLDVQPSIDGEHVVSLSAPDAAEGSNLSMIAPPKAPTTATLSFLSPREISIEATHAKNAVYYFTFVNTGSMTVEYMWQSDQVESEMRSTADLAAFSENLLNRNKTEMSREKQLSLCRPRFFCEKPGGSVLPGETVHTLFSFHSEGCTGLFSQNWRLQTVPTNIVVSFENIPAAFNSDSSKSLQPGQNYLQTATPVKISLHGISASIDECGHQRRITEDIIAKRFVESLCKVNTSFCTTCILNIVSR